MRTTLTINDMQAKDLMQATGQSSAVAAIRLALDDYLRQARKKKVLALRGQVQVEDNWRDLRALEVEVGVARDTRNGNAA